MNKPSPINQTTLRILYYRNKALIIPTILFALCLVIIVEAIFPQVQQWFAIHASISNSLQKIDSLNKNIDVMNSINESDLDAKLSFLSQVLPQDKDYVGILSAISTAAVKSGTRLGDYSFNIGNLSDVGARNNSIQIRLLLSGGIVEAKNFIEQLNAQAPLSSLSDVQVSNNIITIVAAFYFKPFPNVSFQNSQNVITISNQENDYINSLRSTINTASPEAQLSSL